MLKYFVLSCIIIGNLTFGLSSRATRKMNNFLVSDNHMSFALDNKPVIVLRGGIDAKETDDSRKKKLMKNAISLWGSGGMVMILTNSVKRIVPKALEPFAATAVPLNAFQTGAYIVCCLFFAYAEGYKGFQRKFAPMVIARSFTIEPKLQKLHHILLAPFYSMGLFHATRKRKIVSWSISFGIVGIVAVVKRLSYPWKNIIDAGVVVGLSWGALSIAIGYVKALVTQSPPQVDTCLP